jgi:hypothetical protein
LGLALVLVPERGLAVRGLVARARVQASAPVPERARVQAAERAPAQGWWSEWSASASWSRMPQAAPAGRSEAEVG